MLDRFRTYSAERQLLLVGLAALVICGLLLAAWSMLRTPYQPLFTQLRTMDAATIVGDLDKRKIPYRLEDSGATILVPADKVDATRLDVMSGALPLKGTVGFELFNKSDMGLTDFAQRINYQRALQGELERTIMTLDGVDTARVHLSLGEDRIFREDRVPPKASVTVRMREGGKLPAAAALGVQRLVAAAVPQLDPGNVVILDEAGAAIGAALAQAAATPIAPLAETQRGIGEYYAGRLRQALEQAYPNGSIGVEVRIPGSLPPEIGSEAGWSPASRDFPLEISLTPSFPLDPVSRQDITVRAGQAIGFDTTRGDTMVFAAAAPMVAPPIEGIVANQAPLLPEKAEPSRAHPFTGLGGSAAVLGLVGVGMAVVMLRRQPRRALTDTQRGELLGRLKSVLEGEGVDATFRS